MKLFRWDGMNVFIFAILATGLFMLCVILILIYKEEIDIFLSGLVASYSLYIGGGLIVLVISVIVKIGIDKWKNR